MSSHSQPEREIQALRERIAALSTAILRVNAILDVDTVLHEIAESARALTGARYAVIITVDATRQLEDAVLSDFAAVVDVVRPGLRCVLDAAGKAHQRRSGARCGGHGRLGAGAVASGADLAPDDAVVHSRAVVGGLCIPVLPDLPRRRLRDGGSGHGRIVQVGFGRAEEGRAPKQRHRHDVAHDVRPPLLVNCLRSGGTTPEVDAARGVEVSGPSRVGAGTFAGVGLPVVPLEPEVAWAW